MLQVMRHLTDFGKALGEINLLARIKAVASQPALALPPSSHASGAGGVASFAEAAEGVLHSMAAGILSTRRSLGLVGGGGFGAGGGGNGAVPMSHVAGGGDGAVGTHTIHRVSRFGAKDD
jgi:hypothetical protein